MNALDMLSQAARCRRLADATHDPRLRVQMLALAVEFEQKAERPPAAEDRPDAATPRT